MCEGPEQRVSSGQLQNERETRVLRTQNKGKEAADEVRGTGSHSLTAASAKACDENADVILRKMRSRSRGFF